MGLLDDAIREHLELKRLRGADPGEVARQEREALGPVGRGQGADPSASDDATSYGDDGPAEDDGAHGLFDQSGEPGGADEPFERLEPQAAAPPPAEDQVAADVATEHGPGEVGDQGLAVGAGPDREAGDVGPNPGPTDPSVADPGQRAAASASRPGLSPLQASPGEETVEWDAGDTGEHGHTEVAPAPAPAPPGGRGDHAGDDDAASQHEQVEDVLEETPDFLQETPEHERLWFEQQPPRDFDFDK